MSAIKQDENVAKPKAAGCFVSVGPGNLVVSTGRQPKAEPGTGREAGSGTTRTAMVTVKDRASGFAVRLRREEALQLAASLLRADGFLDEKDAPLDPLEFPKPARKQA